MSMIEVSALEKGFGATAVLRGADLEVARGELVVLLGASGGGKTTLLRIIAGLTDADAGNICIDGRSVARNSGPPAPPHRRGIGMVFQDLALWPHLSVLDNVRFGLDRVVGGKAPARRRALDVLRSMGIADLAHRRPHQLSGGQRQRLALARALAARHPLLLLDEPFSNLDPLTKASIAELLRSIRDEGETAILYVTHALDEVLDIAHRVLLLHQGRITHALDAEQLGAMSLEDLRQWYRTSVAAC
jgi:ABC-type sulfate/molybdate transport systems ATPase subunit